MAIDPRRALIATALACGLALVVACRPKAPTPPAPPPPAPIAADQSLWVGLSRSEAQALRVAMMRAQIEVAQRLVSEDAGTAASAHLGRVISDLYAPAKADYALRNLSLDEAAFKEAAAAAASGATRADMARRTEDLLRQIDRLTPRSGQWSKAGTAKRVLQEIAHQYEAGVQSGFVVNDERYQDAFGLAIVAQQIIKSAINDGVAKDRARGPELERETEGLVNMFPSASAPNSPAAAGEVLAQISRVELAFPGME